MKLSGKDYREIQNALTDAFTRAELAQLVLHELDQELDAIAAGKTETELVFDLIAWARRTGYLAQLIAAAAGARPNDATLADLARRFGTAPSAADQRGAAEPDGQPAPLAERKRAQLQERLRLLYDQYDAVNTQYNTTLDAAARVTLDAKVKDLERQIEPLEAELAALSGTDAPASTSSEPRRTESPATTRSTDEDTSTPPPDTVVNTGRALALLVGVDDYEDPFIADLDAAVRDVTALHDLLATRYDTVRLLTDDTKDRPPTRRNILADLRLLADNAGEGDLLLFHFSGHGIAEEGVSYLLGCDAANTALSDTAVSMDRVRSIMLSSPARAEVIILDACHAGASIGRAAAIMTPEFFEHVFELAEGLAVLAACKQGQQSWEWPEKGHGVFTYFLMEALKGEADFGDKHFVTVDDASRYITAGVRRWAIENDAVQTPTKQAEVVGDIVLVDFRNDGQS